MSADNPIPSKGMALRHNLIWLDLVRVLSILLVINAHFCSVGGFASKIPNAVGEGAPLPLLDGLNLWYCHLDWYLIRFFSTQSGILGVALFFMVTGYLMPVMMERYSRTDFLINRLFRIFPLLPASTLSIGLFLFFTQGITF
ncbi:MAG: acyltransferase family protein, partial [Desulfovibrionaceae bacterium]|nr:acyltransferase family protein [Desulfovibrionaceae bacterium]